MCQTASDKKGSILSFHLKKTVLNEVNCIRLEGSFSSISSTCYELQWTKTESNSFAAVKISVFRDRTAIMQF